jgi:hypothetical protein
MIPLEPSIGQRGSRMPAPSLAPATDARAAAITRLIELGEAALRSGAALTVADGARLIGYLSRSRERNACVAAPAPWIVFVLEGHKRVQLSASHIIRAGEAMLLPPGTTLSITNVPDPDTGIAMSRWAEPTSPAYALRPASCGMD